MMQATMIPGVWQWSAWQPERAMYFNAWLVEGDGGTFIVDPLPPDAETMTLLQARAIAAIVVTNRDHERAAATLAETLRAPIFAPAADADMMTAPVARRLVADDEVFGWRVIAFEGFKSPGECALFHGATRTAITGDSLWGVPAGALRFMPDEKLADPARAALSIRQLLARDVRHLLVGDGMPIFERAFDTLAALLDARVGVLARRVNLDELVPTTDPRDPEPFRAAAAEVGRVIGAKRLGYALGRLDPGAVYCPYHWHTREEEAFIVLDGTPSIRVPSGTFALRRGDVVGFPTGPAGAHRLFNPSNEPATVLMFANTDEGDTCFYPDSQKLLVEQTGSLVRSGPILDYYDGEV